MRNKYLISVLIPVLILVAMTIQPLLTLFYGQEIKIKTQPVDPTDLFRGDYVILSYEINDINLTQFPELEKVKNTLGDYEKSREYLNKRVYVSLQPSKGLYNASTASFQKPEQGLYLTGKISYFFNKMPLEQPTKPRPTDQTEPESIPPVKKEELYLPDTVKIEYELDKYFVPENTGLKLEELSRQGQLIATIKTYNGYSLLVKVEQE